MSRISNGLLGRFARIGLAGVVGIVVGCSSHASAPEKTISVNQPLDQVPASRDLDSGPSKLSSALDRLANASDSSRDLTPSGDQTVDVPSSDEIGLPVPGTTDEFTVAIHVTSDVDVNALTSAGAYIRSRIGNTIYASVHAHDLRQVAAVNGVVDIASVPGPTVPRQPAPRINSAGQARDLAAASATGDSIKFDPHGFTGKGVIVAVIDTGVDFHHPDFMNPDGTSRILYLWDMYDNTWTASNHTIGSAPPANFDATTPEGTLYTNDQINAALKGQVKIPSVDTVGHGTACLGTAGGNGLGIAPDADLIVVNSHNPAWGSENDGNNDTDAVPWLKAIAAQRHEPIIISLSYGGHEALHNGAGDEEDAFNKVLNNGDAPGIAICCSAGNEGEDSLHARGRFGPARNQEFQYGQADQVELFVTKETPLVALFDPADDWRLLIIGKDKFLTGADGKNDGLLVLGKASPGATQPGFKAVNLSQADQTEVQARITSSKFKVTPNYLKTDVMTVNLPPGTYDVSAFGASATVPHGVVDFYLPIYTDASFGAGGEHDMVIGAPGDADSVITVGSYDFRGQWQNADGGTSYADMIDPGRISSFSSPGFRRDGVIKPDIASPGQFVISAYAAGSGIAADMGGKDDPNMAILPDKIHVAWRGTSASCPYTAGVVALMFEKDPQLTANQIKQILRDTADHDLDSTGAVPNPRWGYGKLDPAAAIDKVPQGSGTPPPVSNPPVATPPVTNPPPSNPPPSVPPVAPIAPIAPAQTVDFTGTFKGDGMILSLLSDAGPEGPYEGFLANKGQSYPIKGKVIAGQLQGTATNNGQDFAFTATLNGDQLTLQSGGATHNLTRYKPS
jgi:minor extracellular serine protease Vpr